MPIENPNFKSALNEAFVLAKWYAQEHVLLCLIPAFFIAGTIAVFVSQASVIKYFGAKAKRWVAYLVAAGSGTILAVCSCTVLPLFSSIHKRGAGLGPAVAFLYSGPAIKNAGIRQSKTCSCAYHFASTNASLSADLKFGFSIGIKYAKRKNPNIHKKLLYCSRQFIID